VVLTEEDARRLVAAAVRGLELRPLVGRLVVAVLLGLLLAVTWHPVVGVGAAAVLAGLAAALFVLRRRALESATEPGSSRTTGYDHAGSFVVAADRVVVLPRGWAARAERRGGLVVLRPRTRGGRPVILLDDLLTAADEAVLTTATPD
jgi:protein gp37